MTHRIFLEAQDSDDVLIQKWKIIKAPKILGKITGLVGTITQLQERIKSTDYVLIKLLMIKVKQ